MKPIPEMTRDEINRELCERLGYDAEIRCGKCFYRTHYGREPLPKSAREWTEIDFYSDPGKVMLLREMKRQKNYIFFLRSIFVAAPTEEECLSRSIIQPLLDPDGLFTIMALDWLRREQG